MTEAQEKLARASHAISTAALLIKMEMATIKAFLKECRDMENYGHIVDPTLYNKSERKAVSALLEPIFNSAATFVAAHDGQLVRAKDALEKVKAA